jgi:hypothetical protein
LRRYQTYTKKYFDNGFLKDFTEIFKENFQKNFFGKLFGGLTVIRFSQCFLKGFPNGFGIFQMVLVFSKWF